jgi:serine/threonine-protein phosphatase 2B catalytic subunit
MYVPTDEQFWSKEDPSKPDIAFLKNHFYREGRLTEEQALFILEKWVLLPFLLIGTQSFVLAAVAGAMRRRGSEAVAAVQHGIRD